MSTPIRRLLLTALAIAALTVLVRADELDDAAAELGAKSTQTITPRIASSPAPPSLVALPAGMRASPFGGPILRPDLLTAKAIVSGPRMAKLGDLVEFSSELSRNAYHQSWTIDPPDTNFRTADDGKRLFFASPNSSKIHITLHITGTGGDTDSAVVVVDYGTSDKPAPAAIPHDAMDEPPMPAARPSARIPRQPTMADLLVTRMAENTSPTRDTERGILISSFQALNAMIRSTHIGTGRELAAAMAARTKKDLGVSFVMWKGFFEELTDVIDQLEDAGKVNRDDAKTYAPLIDNVVEILQNGR